MIEKEEAFLHEEVERKYPKAFRCTKKIAMCLLNIHQVELTRDEKVYLTLHIYRLAKTSRQK